MNIKNQLIFSTDYFLGKSQEGIFYYQQECKCKNTHKIIGQELFINFSETEFLLFSN